MKKKQLLATLIIAVLVAMAGCGKKKEAEGPGAVEIQAEQPSPEQKEEQKEPETTGENEAAKPADIEQNIDTGIYFGADTLANIPLGAYVNGAQTVLCNVKMPTNYIIGSLYMEENGQSISEMEETNGRLISTVIEEKGLENSLYVPNTVVITAQGNVLDSYTFVIIQSSEISVSSEKEYAPGGIDINVGLGHDAYIYNTSGQFDIAMVYQINDEWSLLIENSGELKDKMSLEEIGKGLYDLVTPVN